MSDPGVMPPPAEGSITLPRSAPKAGLSIRSVLLIMLLVVSTGSSVVVGLIGYHNGRTALEDAAFRQLIEVRDSRARELVSLFDSMENTLTLVARGESAAEALTAFTAGFQELESAELTDEERAQLQAYYTDDFGSRLEAAYDEPVDVQTFVPTGAAESYLELKYTVPAADFAAAIAINDAGDGSAWSEAHTKYHDFFRRMTELFRFEDVLLIDATGNIVYTAYKGVDLGSNLENGPLHLTNLAAAYSEAISGNRADVVVLSDFDEYAPSLGVPAAWAVTPVAVNGTVIGAMAVELPISAINEVMTGGGNWADSGLGETGETYIVGANDQLMRSQSRDMLEDPEGYAEEAIASGMTPAEAARVVESQQTLLLQPVRTDAVDEAIAGRSGTTLTGGYLGGETIAAYAPLDIDGLDWVIVAEFDTAEAFAPVNEFTRNLVLSSALIVVVVSLLSLLIAGFIVRPLRRLRDAARRIAAGEVGVQVDAGTSDELSDVGVAFNDMSRSLQVKAALLEEQQAENERLLLSIMPENLVRRYKEGAKTIAFDHQEVSVIFADIVGFESFSRSLGSEVALERLNEILLACSTRPPTGSASSACARPAAATSRVAACRSRGWTTPAGSSSSRPSCSASSSASVASTAPGSRCVQASTPAR